ncbi:MAG: hypothetical protein AB8B50_17695 [Pirellulaceae bacterium]
MNSENPDTLSFTCGDCGKRLKAAPKLAGRRVRCPKCKGEVRVPGTKRTATGPELSQEPGRTATPDARKKKLTSSSDSAATPTADSVPTEHAPARPKTNFLEMDDPFSLAEPAIEDLAKRQEQSDQVRAAKDKKRRDEQAKEKRRKADIDRRLASSENATAKGAEGFKPPKETTPTPLKPVPEELGSIPFDDALEEEDITAGQLTPKPEDLSQTPAKGAVPSGVKAGSTSADTSSASSDSEAGSSFDDDEMQLAPLADESAATPTKTPFLPPLDALDDLDELVPEFGNNGAVADELAQADEEELLEDAQYRVVCVTCGTAQYVSPSVQGMKIKCPDCFSDFKAPPPPKDWKPKKSKKLPIGAEIGLSPEVAASVMATEQKQKLRTEQLLDRAREEANEEDEEAKFQLDFDNSTFLQRTFGFLWDAITMGQAVLYAVLFGGLFAIAQVCLADTTSSFGKVTLLFATIFLPAIGILFALPMLSGGLGLIEAVANRQKVKEVPSFNMFDNFGDLLVVFVAFAGGIIPGYVLGMAVGGLEPGALFFRAAGMVIVGVGLFPLFLLSMMDNGSIFAPISASVVGSIRSAKESWGTYYIKTFCFTAGILLLWLVMLGRSPTWSGIAGALLPLLIYFTCQQVGVLANDIGEHLSFEFHSSSDDDEEEEENEGREELLDEDL